MTSGLAHFVRWSAHGLVAATILLGVRRGLGSEDWKPCQVRSTASPMPTVNGS